MPSLSLTRLLSLLAALALVAAACGGGDDASEDGASASASDSASASASASEPADDEEGATDDGGAAEEAGDAAGYPITVTDAYGTEFTFDEPPRVGCAWYGCIEVGAELGVSLAAATLSAEEVDSSFFGRIEPEVLIVDFTNPEEWAAADVDIVMLSPASRTPDLDPVGNVVDLFYLHYDNFLGDQWEGVIGGYDGYIENLRLMGQVMNAEAEAEAAVERFDTMVDNLATYATPETEQQTVAVIGLLGYASLGPGSGLCQVLNEAGHGTCIGDGVAAMLNAEAFLAENPDLIIDVDPDSRAGDPVWPNLSAVQNDNVYNFQTTRYYCCSTAGLILAAQEYVAQVFPDAGIPAPGPDADFDPSTSPLVIG
ncbi:MAG: ABC transporter substrate-binding protein [Actinomycetota bacterium]